MMRSIALYAAGALTLVNPYTGPVRFLTLCLLAVTLLDAHGARIRDARPLMGTVVEVSAEGPDERALRAAAEGAFREMQRLADIMSHYDPASVVSAVNEAAGVLWVPAPPELVEVLAQARRVSERTGGAFDITVGALGGWNERRIPTAQELAAQLGKVDYRKVRLSGERVFLADKGMRLDLGGIAKLYILDAGRRVLEARGVPRALVNGGGDVVAHSDGAPWQVGVRDPLAPKKLLGAVPLVRGAVASSGDYERYFERDGRRFHHILDPRTGYPAEGVRGVTLVGPSAEAVNGLGPAIMVLGAHAGKKLVAANAGIEGLIVDARGELWTSSGLGLRPAR
jgi:thiamine biosynthesis lipoprotein